MNAILKPKDKPMGLQARIERLTPEMAQHLLQNMVLNRPLKHARVAMFTNAMKNGVFDALNGETLIINENGRLEDGQHRLTAFIESELASMDFFVVRGVKEGSGTTVDQGTPRGPGDVAAMLGYANGKTLMAACRWLWIYDNAYPEGLASRSHTMVPTQTLINFLKVHDELATTMEEVRSSYMPVAKLMTASVAIFTRVVTERLSVDQSKAFFEALKTGETTPDTRQVRGLRDKLLGRFSKTGRLNGAEVIVLTARVWNAMRENRDLQKLFVTKEHGDFSTAPRFR